MEAKPFSVERHPAGSAADRPGIVNQKYLAPFLLLKGGGTDRKEYIPIVTKTESVYTDQHKQNIVSSLICFTRINSTIPGVENDGLHRSKIGKLYYYS